ncbi:MAG: Na+/H+ antiporter NhaA [Gammaproteobacteria bacterium]|nr:Na+/H+ antiporter NhaA [Gammaproteobacteria bacterium]
MVMNALREFLRLESASGILLLIAAVLAMAVENSAARPLYGALLGTPVEVRIGALEIAKPLLLWVNDGLMAAFFFLVGLELKREILQGELSDRSQITLPVLAAIGGMLVPALVYVAINRGDAAALRGWAIPSATDIAFALGVLSLLGKRVPTALKLFLMTLAIIDDIGAIAIIALFYTEGLSTTSLLIALAAFGVLFLMNRRGVVSLFPYLAVGLILWVAVLKSGVHATLAGVMLALFIPLRTGRPDASPLERLEHDLHPTVAYGILPLFAFMNTGVPLDGLSWDSFTRSVPLGIALGLFLGKQVGVFGFSWLAIRLGFARLPERCTWSALYGVSLLCGIGFTMSLFIGSLAFDASDASRMVDGRLGILSGSLLSALAGYCVLRVVLRQARGDAS